MRSTSARVFTLKLFSGACIVLDALYWASGLRGDLEPLAVVSILILSLFLCVHTRRNTLLFLMSFAIAYSNYSAMVANYSFGYALKSTYDTMYQGMWVASEGTFVLLLFMSTLVLCLPADIEEVALGDFFDRYRGNYSLPVVLGLSVVLIVIWFTCSSGFSDTGGRGEANQLFEYSYIFFILGFYFSGRRRGLQGILLAIAALYVLQNVLTGNRAGVLAILMLVYALYVAGRWSTAQIAPVLLIGFIVFMVIGGLREDLLGSLDRIPAVASGIFSRWAVWDTVSYAYHQGLAFVRLAHDASVGEVNYLAGQWLAGIFLGGTGAPDSALSQYAQRAYPGMGGGFTPFYFYFYFGVFGAAATGVAVAAVFSLVGGVSQKNSDLGLMVRLCLFATVFRWYLYSPAPLTRGVLLMCIVGVLLLFMTGCIRLGHIFERSPIRCKGRWENLASSQFPDAPFEGWVPSACIGQRLRNSGGDYGEHVL